MVNNRVCYFCKKEYHYCPTCGEDIYKPSWYSMWCSETCKQLDSILVRHTSKMLSTAEAKKQIESLGLEEFVNINNVSNMNHLLEIVNYSEDAVVMSSVDNKTATINTQKKTRRKSASKK